MLIYGVSFFLLIFNNLVIALCQKTGIIITKGSYFGKVKNPMNNAILVNQDSGCVDYITPAPIIEAARRVLGHIDLDPASNSIANQTVKALNYYDEQGLERFWYGNVWMNHPFSREHNADWINRLIAHYEGGFVDNACCICFASTSESWFKPLMQYPQCYLSPRTNYIGLDGKPRKGVPKGSVVTYLGWKNKTFAQEFAALGSVMIPAYLCGSL